MFLNGTRFDIKDSNESEGTIYFENNCGYGPQGGLIIKKVDKIIFGVYTRIEDKEEANKLVLDACDKL